MLFSLLALPQEIFFWFSWILASLFRPFCIVSLLLVLLQPTAALSKATWFGNTLVYLVFCNDKKWKKPKQDASVFETHAANIESKTVLFVRHGESAWNETFNKGADRTPLQFALAFLPGLLKALIYEWYFWVAGQATQSWFYDSPLSQKGVNQATSIHEYLTTTKLDHVTPQEQRLLQILLGQQPVLYVSSNLCRAMATMAVGFQTVLKEQQPLHIWPCLQEISRNPDALSATPPHGECTAAWSDPMIVNKIYKTAVDTSCHTGNKTVSSNGLVRMQQFVEQLQWDAPHPVVAGGHSLWFRSFFRTYLSIEHRAKKHKIVNGGVVACVVQRVQDEDKRWHYRVEPTSIVELHRGFG